MSLLHAGDAVEVPMSPREAELALRAVRMLLVYNSNDGAPSDDPDMLLLHSLTRRLGRAIVEHGA